MTVCLDVLGVEDQACHTACRERTVRPIGEILPWVVAQYGIDLRELGVPVFPSEFDCELNG